MLPLIEELPEEDTLLRAEALSSSVPLAAPLIDNVSLAQGLLELESLEVDVPLPVAEAHSDHLDEAEAASDTDWPALALQGDADEEAVPG